MSDKTKIHFVCRNNIYRSRLAEAYARSLRLSGWEVSSSGIEAGKFVPDHSSPWTVRIAKTHGLTKYLSPTRTQTTQSLIDNADVVVFMNHDVYRDAKRMFKLNDDRCLTWSVKDHQEYRAMPASAIRRRTMKLIKSGVDQLSLDALHGGMVDIVSSANEPLGYRMPLAITNQKGLWHRGCHVIITTPGNQTLIQKRSKSIIFSPNLIDITLGGHVDSGETPEQAIVREIREETGLMVHPSQLKLLETHKWASYHPRYKTHSNAFIYTYHVALQDWLPALTIQEDEVAMMKLVSDRQLKRLLRAHSLRKVGKLNYAHAYYKRIVALAGQFD